MARPVKRPRINPPRRALAPERRREVSVIQLSSSEDSADEDLPAVVPRNGRMKRALVTPVERNGPRQRLAVPAAAAAPPPPPSAALASPASLGAAADSDRSTSPVAEMRPVADGIPAVRTEPSHLAVVADVARMGNDMARLERRNQQLLRILLANTAAFDAPAVPADVAPDGTVMRGLGPDGRRWVLVGACQRSGRAVYGIWCERDDGEAKLRLYIARTDRWGTWLDGAADERVWETEVVVRWHRVLANLSDRERVGWVVHWLSD